MGFDFLTHEFQEKNVMCFPVGLDTGSLFLKDWFLPRTIIVSMSKKIYKKLFISRIGFSWSLLFHGKYHFMCIHESPLFLLLNGWVFPVKQTSASL